MKKRSIPLGKGWSLSLDKGQIFPDDPGQGTPAMVYGPFGANATLACALNEGEARGSRGGYVTLPTSVYRKLEAAAEEANDWLYGDTP